jgi:radical SAM/Cys-rich protein
MLDTTPLLKNTNFPRIYRSKLTTLQVNLGYLCNLSCTHCHVNAGPKRTELATLETVDHILTFIHANKVKVLDVTGGAPEMNPHFRYLVKEARLADVEVIDRCNLTILNEPGYEDLAEFMAHWGVTISASLPCYQEQNVSEQRGKGVFSSSIEALQTLNTLGYGVNPSRKLNLVYNPNGAFLPPAQESLEAAYKAELQEQYGIRFNDLLTITNMPISRFGGMLLAKDLYHDYMTLLKDNYAEKNLSGLMCRSLLSIDWQGYVYDCDFNQMLNWPMRLDSSLIVSDKKAVHISELYKTTASNDGVGNSVVGDESMEGNEIVIGEHCYACTAGQGSSCGGALE